MTTCSSSTPPGSQFHQYFMSSFFKQKFFVQLLYAYNLRSYFFGKRILAQKLLIKCWWNWHQLIRAHPDIATAVKTPMTTISKKPDVSSTLFQDGAKQNPRIFWWKREGLQHGKGVHQVHRCPHGLKCMGRGCSLQPFCLRSLRASTRMTGSSSTSTRRLTSAKQDSSHCLRLNFQHKQMINSSSKDCQTWQRILR